MATAHPFLLVRTAGLPFARIGPPAADWPALESAVKAAGAARIICETALLATFDDALGALPAGNLRTAVYNARKDFFKKKCLPAPAFLQEMESRIPALAQAMRGWEQAVAALRVARDRCMEQYDNALVEAYRRIQAVAAEPEFQRALLFAGHDLLDRLPHFSEKNPEEFSKKERRTALAVHQYATRMATRTVPLGRFATVSLHALNVESDPEAEPMPDFGKSVVGPNVALLEALYTVLLREPVFYRALHVRLNPCIAQKNGAAYRWLYFDGETESFQETPATPLLDHLVESFLENKRRMAFAELLTHLPEVVEATPEALEAWLLDLADTGFLEWELPEAGLSPDWCGGLYRFLGFLPAEPVVVDTASLLQTLRTTARTLPYLPPLEAVAAQRAVAGQVREYFGRWKMEGVLPIPPEQLFYEDVERPTGVPVPDPVFHNLLNQLA
ncbi:MAG: lantibiotic dehydratase, partial [Saprospiraceae bacterium]|nr:lantibiotic dehydratase [Saprospiraceae bacterium]